ncbi:MAG: CIA30 family protein [Methylococcaceae bacterium]|jgi:monofunctional biosynthetic peptidoglycan transglycosylase|nr:CIA30 family protein [Methylococcaceae bacterium]
MLIKFSDTEEVPRWIAINDDVMGGISKSRIELSPTATALFSGQLALENKGGFASIRRRSDYYNLDGCTGVIFKVKGDGRTYQFRVKTDDLYDGVAYRTLFATDARHWQTIALPFDIFCASFRGRPVPGAPVLRPEQIRQIGFLLADKQPGSFSLEIAWIKSFQA